MPVGPTGIQNTRLTPGTHMLTSIAIYPPLAFARVGSSDTPCAAYSWRSAKLSPDQPASTTLQPEETLLLGADGTVSSSVPNEIVLKDPNGAFRPVCPFFELWGTWEENGTEVEGPLTPEILSRFGLSLSDVTWSVDVGNLKPYHITLRDGDRINARHTLAGDDTARHEIFGRSPGVAQPLVGHPDGIPMGAVQLSRPDDAFPELRLRFYAPKGVIYGPPDIDARIDAALAAKPDQADDILPWRDLVVPAERHRVNPDSSWGTHDLDATDVPPLGPGDGRLNPGGLVASVLSRVIGLVDDVGDGLISCRIGGLTAKARIAVGPPDFAPMNRPVVSLQDGLSDRENRASARDGTILDDELEAIVADIFERALETSDLMNKDAQNYRARITNRTEYAGPSGGNLDLPNPSPSFEASPHRTLWPTIDQRLSASPAYPVTPQSVDAMPVTMVGQRKHRRYNAIEYFRDRLREEPDLIEKWIRIPRPPERFYDRRMPALMRGSDRNAMHLTRRQYELIQLWAKRQRENA